MAEQFAPWGAEAMGSRLLEKDIQAAELNKLAVQKAQAEVPLLNAHTALYQAQAAEHAAKVEQAKQQQAALAALAKNQALDPEEDPLRKSVRDLQGYASVFEATGELDKARQVHSTLSQTVARGVMSNLREAQQLKTEFETQKLMADKALGYIRGAQSQEDIQRAGDAFAMEYGFRPKLFNMQYSPENVQRALAAGMTERQAAQTRHDSEMEKLRSREVDIRATQAEASIARSRAAVSLMNARQERLGKTEGKPMGAATPREMSEAQDLVLKQYPELKGQESYGDLKVLSASVVGEAKQQVSKNRGMTWSAALANAVQNHADDVKLVKEARWNLPILGETGTKERTRVILQGRTPSSALELPKNPTPGNLVSGRYYNTPKGVLRWNGEKLVSPSPAARENLGASNLGDETGDEE